jgi:hypothetical protein
VPTLAESRPGLREARSTIWRGRAPALSRPKQTFPPHRGEVGLGQNEP